MVANINSIQPLSDPFTFSIPARGTRGTASAVPLVLLPLSTTLASRQNCCRKPCRKDTGGSPSAILSGLFHRTPLGKTLLQKHEEDGEDQTHEGGEVVPMKGFPFEEEGDNQSEDDEGDNLLDNF